MKLEAEHAHQRTQTDQLKLKNVDKKDSSMKETLRSLPAVTRQLAMSAFFLSLF